MSQMKDDANGLDNALKRGTGSARHLAFEVAGIKGGLGASVHAAAELAEGLAKVSKSATIAASATGIGAVVAIIGTAIALTIGWHEKTEQIARDVKNIGKETEALNASARNNQRLSQEIKITEQRDKQLEAIDQERGLFGEMQDGLAKLEKSGGVLGTIAKTLHLSALMPVHDYSALKKAINDQADAAVKDYHQAIQRKFEEQRASTYDDVARQVAGRIADSTASQIELARIDEASSVRSVLTNGEYTDEMKTKLISFYHDLFTQTAETIEYNSIKPLGDQLGRSFISSITDGISAGIQSGSIGEGFKALTGGILIGFGSMLIEIGTQSLLAANLLNTIITALRSFAPAGAIGPSLALIALGGVLVGLGSALGGGRGHGGGNGSSGYGSSGGTTIIDRGLINPANGLVTSPGLIRPDPSMFTNVWLIGKDDPTAVRDLYDMWSNARRRLGASVA
jgi:hypothetical protein